MSLNNNINIGLIGKGKWGAVIEKKLKELKYSVKVLKKKYNFFKQISDLDVIFISTPDNTHYDILKKLSKTNKKIFCEKPISRKVQNLKIVKDFKKKKLYISDSSSFYPKRKFFKKNIFVREKNELNNKILNSKRYDLLYRFAYHDLGYIYHKLGHLDYKRVQILRSKKFLEFLLIFNKYIFHFLYKTHEKKKIYSLNKKTFYTREDIIKKMINAFIIDKVDYVKNIKKALIISQALDKIKKEIKISNK